MQVVCWIVSVRSFVELQVTFTNAHERPLRLCVHTVRPGAESAHDAIYGAHAFAITSSIAIISCKWSPWLYWLFVLLLLNG